MKEKFYQHSGESTLVGFLVALSLGIVLAIFFSFIYNFLIVTIPIVYINFLITLGFGFSLGYAIKFLSRLGKIRNHKQIIIAAGITGYTGFYFQWIAYFIFLSSGEHTFESFKNGFQLIWHPGLFLDMLIELNQVGSWSMFGILFTDFPLWFIWGLEAAIIIGIPILIATKHPLVPFSENLNKWYRKLILKNQFQKISSYNEFKNQLFQNAESTILNLKHGEAFRYSEVSIYFLENEDKQYLSIDNIFIEDRGRGKKNLTSVVHLLEISIETANTLIDKFGAKKESVLNY